MKRFITYCLVAVALFFGATTATMSGGDNVGDITVSNDQHQSSSPAHHSCFSAMDLFQSAAIANSHIRLTYSVQHLSFRVLHSFSNAFRINYSVRIDFQKYVCGSGDFLLKASFKQLDGYYLYHLRKLLI
jgi:hypothetical protein